MIHGLASVHPRLREPKTRMLYLTQAELFKALKLTLLGTSSAYYTWDVHSETFLQANTEDKGETLICIDGKDEIVSHRSV